MTASFIKSPQELVGWNRFDLPFKYLYAQSKRRGLKTPYFENMYRHHLQVWNNFSEYNNPSKQSYQDFKLVFDDLIDNLARSGFDSRKSMVPVKNGIYLLNGAHRVAACLANNVDVCCYEGEDIIDGQLDCSWSFFKQHTRFGHLDSNLSDHACLELLKYRPKTRIVTLYPSAVNLGKIDQVRKILKNRANLVYEKSIALSKVGGLNLMRELYYKEEWAEKNNGAGYAAKAGFCYKPKNLFGRMSPTYIFIVEFEDAEEALSVKQEIRDIYKLDKHSLHINDTHEQTVRLAKCMLNNNSVDFLNKFNGQMFPVFEELLSEYQLWIGNNNLDPENYCVSAGSVLTAYGLKECKDIDYLHSDKNEMIGNDLIQSHNNYGVGRYHLHRDDIIHNPENHFYRYGVKYSTLTVVKKLKQKRAEEKDFRDIALIDKLL